MGYNIAFQLASLGIVLYITILYVFMKRLPTKSNKLFYALLLTTAACLITDSASEVSIFNERGRDTFVNQLIDTVYLLILMFFAFVVFVYINYNTAQKPGFSLKRTLIYLLPMIICGAATFFIPSRFHYDPAHFFSFGMKLYPCAVCAAFYIIASMIHIARSKKNMPPLYFLAFLSTVIIEIVVGTIEFLFPSLYVISYGTTLICICIFLTIENPSMSVEPISGIFNKNGLITLLNFKFSEQKPFSIVFVHIEDYRRVAASFGVREADAHVAAIGRDISKIRSGTVFLSKSDELCIILDCDEKKAVEQAYNISFYLSRPCTICGIEYVHEYHIGVISCPSNADSVDNVFATVGYTLSHARTGKINTVTVFDRELVDKQKRQLQIQTILREAIANDGFLVFYQPIYSSQTREMVSAEALLRLKDHSIGFIGPDEFIPIAESCGLIIPIGMRVFELVCRFISENRLSETGLEFVEINLSGVQCMQHNLAEQLLSVMERYKIPTDFINLEITETAAMNSADTLSANMNRIIGYGSSFSLDDFGSGYSNVQYIMDFPFSIIKIDKNIVWSYFDEKNKKAKTVLEANIAMMKKLELKIIAEGVETAEQAEMLSEMGIDLLQGFHFSKPLPPELFLPLL